MQVSMLGKGFGDVGEAKGSSTTGSQFLEQFKTAQALAQLAAQHSQPGSSTAASSWDMGSATQTSSLVQYGKGSGSAELCEDQILKQFDPLPLRFTTELSSAGGMSGTFTARHRAA